MENTNNTSSNSLSWKLIPGYDNYRISIFGEVQKKTKKGWRNIKPGLRNGYPVVSLTKDLPQKGTRKDYLHRIVVETFIGQIPPGALVEHIDDNRSNNALTNLKISNHSANAKTARDLNKVGRQKLTWKEVEQIRRSAHLFTRRELAEMHNCCISNIAAILTERSWIK